MKKLLLNLVTSIILMSCGNMYHAPAKVEVSKTAQYEGGSKEDGVVNMFLTYNPITEDPKVNLEESKTNAELICKNWGYSTAELQREELHTNCISFNLNTGKCIRYKLYINAYCK